MTALHPLVESVRTLAHARQPISLAELGESALMERVDTKYVMTLANALEIINGLPASYRVLEVGGRRLCRYHTRYFDTADFALYHAHHAGRVPRHKVRLRCYVESEVRFLELKRRNNRGVTTKARVAADAHMNVGASLSAMRSALLDFPSGIALDALRPVLDVDYLRVTFVETERVERVTLDLDLRMSIGDRSAATPALAVLEVKQGGARRSAAHAMALSLHSRPLSFSKYCIGVALLQPGVKTNNYRATLRQLDALQLAGSSQHGGLRDVA